MAVSRANTKITIGLIASAEALGEITAKALELGFIVTSAERDREDDQQYELTVATTTAGYTERVASAMLALTQFAQDR